VQRNQFKLTSLVKGLTKPEGRVDRRGRLKWVFQAQSRFLGNE